jgi:uncharacterized membrane protein
MSEEVRQYLQTGKKNLILIYALFLGGILIPLLPFIGAVFAYANLSCSNIIWQTHYVFAFRTFCFSLVGIFIATIFPVAFVCHLLYALTFVWAVVRSIVALRLLLESNSYPNPLTFWIK